MKFVLSFVVVALTLVACGERKQPDASDKNFEEAHFSPHKGTGKIETVGDMNSSFEIDTANGDKILCGPTDKGFQIFVGPKEYSSDDTATGLTIIIPKNLNVSGNYKIYYYESVWKLSYGRLNKPGVWAPGRDRMDCSLEVKEIDGSIKIAKFQGPTIGIKVDCGLDEILLGKKEKARLKADVQCNVIDMTSKTNN